eukprot:TRINITY_DN13093_c0_g1_i1.p1 TRINITY_DN13093_c0_g1~~TRINITY_DN13093_c0_g1_i1.p1  ORF type:complete len:390 (+),score=-12.67 TRINITY_DN13093_c0_g1_i1:90-1259(+)
MTKRSRDGALTAQERRVVKSLLARGWRNQDIQALVNRGRNATVNSARVTEVKQNTKQRVATNEEVDFFIAKKHSFDPKTGLNLYDDERLIRARESMILAVQIFNSAGLKFKTEVFAVIANIAWTYLLHEFYERRGTKIVGKDGRSLLLSQMVERHDVPLTDGMKNNLRSLKVIRDEVEHLLLGKSDVQWQSLFQACCLNFDRVLTENFGANLSLSEELGLAIQFAKMDIAQLSELNPFDIPSEMKAIDASLSKGMTEDQLRDLDYQFSVVYTLTASSKSKAHMHFVRPESSEGKAIQNILVKYKASDELYPHKPGTVCTLVSQSLGSKFNMSDHTLAWKKHKVRPHAKAKNPANTNLDYCMYHQAHHDYTYSDAWVDLLVSEKSNPQSV